MGKTECDWGNGLVHDLYVTGKVMKCHMHKKAFHVYFLFIQYRLQYAEIHVWNLIHNTRFYRKDKKNINA